jgi:hypothetical protein
VRWSKAEPAVLGTAILALVVTGLAVPAGDAGAATKAATDQAAAQALVTDALDTANQQPSVHYVATSSAGSMSIRLVADAATAGGQQQVTEQSGKTVGHATGVLAGGAVYYMGDRAGLSLYLGMSNTLASKYKGQWIEFSPSDPGFSAIAQQFTLGGAVSQISIKGPFKTASTTVGGEPATSIAGSTTALSTSGKKGPAVLVVTTSGPDLPVRFSGSGTQDSTAEHGTIVFSGWGEAVNPAVPTSAVPASTIENG